MAVGAVGTVGARVKDYSTAVIPALGVTVEDVREESDHTERVSLTGGGDHLGWGGVAGS